MSILYVIFVGLVAGLLAGYLNKTQNFGLFWNSVVGILGSVVGYAILRTIVPGVDYGLFGDIMVATFGAIVLLALLNFVRLRKG